MSRDDLLELGVRPRSVVLVHIGQNPDVGEKPSREECRGAVSDHRPAATIRPLIAGDLPAFSCLAADPRVTRHVGDGSPWNAERARDARSPDNCRHSVVSDGQWAGILTLEPATDGDR